MQSRLLEIEYSRKKGLLTEQQKDNDSIVKNTLLDLGLVLEGTFTFGTGITAFLPIVRDIINLEQPQITEQSIILVYITAMWILLNRHKDKVQKLIQIIREQGLSDALSRIVDFLKSLENVVLKVADEVGYAASSIADVGAFTFLAFPILDGLVSLVSSGDITYGEPAGYLKSILISIGILSIKNVFNSIIRKVKSRFGTLDESKHIMKYNDCGIGSDVLKVVRKTLFVESKELWILPKDIDTNKKYRFNGISHNIELSISRNSKLKENYSINITEGKTNNFKIILEINPLSEPKVYKNIKTTLKECFGRYGYSPISLTLNEQAEDKTIRTVFDDANYKIVVPLTMETFCELSKGTKWCENKYMVKNISRGTNYIIYNKNNNSKTLIHDNNRVFLLRDDNVASYTLYDSQSDISTHINVKKFLSSSTSLSEFFNISYTATDRIRFDMGWNDEELRAYSLTNDFSKAVYDIIKEGLRLDDLQREEMLEPYLGEKADFNEGGYRGSHDDTIWIDVQYKGVRLLFDEETYKDSILDLNEDDAYYYDMAMYVGGGDHEYMEWEELDYICSSVTSDVIAKIGAVLLLLNPSIDITDICEEGILTELLEKYYNKEWDNTGNNILSAMGYGLGEYRAGELKKIIQHDLVIEAEDVSDGYMLPLTYIQLLAIITTYNLKTFSDLLESGFNNIDGGLSDAWFDEWGYPDETQEEINLELAEFLEKIETEGEIDIQQRRKHYEEYDRVIKYLNFEKDNYQPVYNLERLREDFKGDKYTVYYRLSDFNPIDTTVTLYVGTEKPYGEYQNQINSGTGKTYKIKINEVSDYVLSDDLFAPEQMKIKRGDYKGDLEILQSREESEN